MEIIRINTSNRENFLSKAEASVFALGFFDGMHLGHQKVIRTAKRIADENSLTLATMSFFPHPKEIFSQDKTKVSYLMPLVDKERILKKLGVQKLYIVEFDQTFANLSPKQFVHQFLLDFGAKYIVAGFDFTYGFKGAGHMDRLKEDAAGMLEVIKIEKVKFAGEKISSTLIRQLIHSGKIDQIPNYLGEPYHTEGKVTIKRNLAIIHLLPYYLLPPPGIYEVTVFTGERGRIIQASVTERGHLYLIRDIKKAPFRQLTIKGVSK